MKRIHMKPFAFKEAKFKAIFTIVWLNKVRLPKQLLSELSWSILNFKPFAVKDLEVLQRTD